IEITTVPAEDIICGDPYAAHITIHDVQLDTPQQVIDLAPTRHEIRSVQQQVITVLISNPKECAIYKVTKSAPNGEIVLIEPYNFATQSAAKPNATAAKAEAVTDKQGASTAAKDIEYSTLLPVSKIMTAPRINGYQVIFAPKNEEIEEKGETTTDNHTGENKNGF
ncbi:MAG: hypothetical protein RLZZ292_882, partial [Bacteroidota bacterium]